MSSNNFYSDLPSFSDFSGVAEYDQYYAFPDDWVLLISDVVGSTKEIAKGRYKHVNMVGAASIISVLNLTDDHELPFMFGGDGGTIAVPPELAEAGTQALQKLQAGCHAMFGLDLRAAAFRVSELRNAGAELLVRKFQLNQHNNLAMFAGSGIEVAEGWLKSLDSEFDNYRLQPLEGHEPDLEGLTCRWEPLHSTRGTMMSVIVQQIGAQNSELTGKISEVLGKPISECTPVRKQTLKYRFPPKGLALEVAASSSATSRFKRYSWAMFTALMQLLCERFKIKIGDYDGAAYQDELIASTDFRKYDGALRMVIDITDEQAENLEQWLEHEFQRRRLVYGTWRSQSALMTCMLFDLKDSKHLHLIDGSNGGYALAAREFKQKLAEIKKP